MQIIKYINQIVAFLLEISMFILLGYIGFKSGKTMFLKYFQAFCLPLIAIALWGIFAAPNSTYRLGFTARIVFELILFLSTSLLIYKSGFTKLSFVFGITALLSEIVAFVLKQ